VDAAEVRIQADSLDDQPVPNHATEKIPNLGDHGIQVQRLEWTVVIHPDLPLLVPAHSPFIQAAAIHRRYVEEIPRECLV
jgi:hypothetical protein